MRVFDIFQAAFDVLVALALLASLGYFRTLHNWIDLNSRNISKIYLHLQNILGRDINALTDKDGAPKP